MRNVSDIAVQVAAVTGAVLFVLGVVWRVVRPRVREALRELLNTDTPGTVAHNAAQAAGAVSEVAELRVRVDRLADAVDRATVAADRLADIPARVELLEVAQEATERRLGAVEQALILDLQDRQRGRRT